jgi:hypothetical protein
MTCEQLDRRDSLMALVPDNPNDRTLNMNLNELEKAITANLGRLGFTPSDRSRLGFTIAKTESKLEATSPDGGQVIQIITGPPCGGKSTYITDRAKPGDIIVDMDGLRLH